MISNIPALKENGITIENPVHKAQIFNDHFSQTQLYDNNTELPHLVSFPSDKRISLISVSYSEVLSLLKNVNVSKACGHDGIGNKVIKMCAEGLYESFTNLINLMFLLGQLPQSWKLANVIPLFKKGNRQFKGRLQSLLRTSVIVFAWGLHRKLGISVCTRSSLISGNNTRVVFFRKQRSEAKSFQNILSFFERQSVK